MVEYIKEVIKELKSYNALNIKIYIKAKYNKNIRIKEINNIIKKIEDDRIKEYRYKLEDNNYINKALDSLATKITNRLYEDIKYK
jgi:hypothetical protein